MTEPYRTAGMACPTCTDAPLREHQNRYVCDSCQGMLVGDADLVDSLRATGAMGELVASDAEPASAKCPRCTQPMQSCALAVGADVLFGRYLRCATDGTWLTQPQLVGTLARASRRSAAPRGLSAAASAYADIAPKGSGTAALQGIGNAFTQNQRQPIGYQPPRVRVAFVSAFHGRELACPACADHPALVFVGDRWVCRSCTGALVEDAALVAMVSDIRAEPWQMPRVAGKPGERACPVCGKQMIVESLGGVTIERCEGHATWFDEAELGEALYQTSEPPPEPSGGLGGWLRRLFPRSRA